MRTNVLLSFSLLLPLCLCSGFICGNGAAGSSGGNFQSHGHNHGHNHGHGHHGHHHHSHGHSHDHQGKCSNNFIEADHFDEGDFIVSKTLTIPFDLLGVTFEVEGTTAMKPSVTIYYRVGEKTNLSDTQQLNTPWQSTNQDSLSAKDLNGKLVQFAVKEADFSELKVLKWKFETEMAAHFGDKFVSRQEWCARSPRNDLSEWTRAIDAFVVLHTAGKAESTNEIAHRVQDLHMDDNKWSDMGYHFMIGVDGKIYEGRSLQYQGAHTKGHNLHTVGIAAMGCFDTNACAANKDPKVGKLAEVTDDMVLSFGELIGFLAYKKHIDVSRMNVKGRTELVNDVPPGDRVMAKMDKIVEIAQQELKDLQGTSASSGPAGAASASL